MCKFETPNKSTVQTYYVVNKDKVGNISRFRNSKRFEHYRESWENIKLKNVSETIIDKCQSCENLKKKQIDENIIPKGCKERDKKHKNKVSIKVPNIENVKSEFRNKLKNLLTKFKEIFEGSRKLKDFKGCLCYIFASLFFKSKREHLLN